MGRGTRKRKKRKLSEEEKRFIESQKNVIKSLMETLAELKRDKFAIEFTRRTPRNLQKILDRHRETLATLEGQIEDIEGSSQDRSKGELNKCKSLVQECENKIDELSIILNKMKPPAA